MATCNKTSASDQVEQHAHQLQLLVSSCNGFKNIILDMGGVFLSANLDVDHGTAVSPEMFKRMRRSHVWFDYETGKLSSQQAFQQLSLLMNVHESEITMLIQRARESLAPVPELVHAIQQLRAVKLRVFCMSNVSREDFDYVRGKFPSIMAHFEKVFTSADCGMRKPSLNFFRYVMKEASIQPSETLFVDNTLENVVSAESLGIKSVFATNSAADTVRELIFYLRNKQEKFSAAWEYKDHLSFTSDGISVRESFSHFLIANVLNDAQFLPNQADVNNGNVFNFFGNDQKQTRLDLPTDMDTISIALSVLLKFSKVDEQTITATVEKMKDLVDHDGIVQVYFDPLRPRLDPIVATNIVFLFHLAGQAEAARKSEEFIRNVLLHRAYLRGTLYYSSTEAFLFFLARLVQANEAHFGDMGVTELLRERLREVVGCMQGDALQVAMRMLACSKCGLAVDKRDRERLEHMQHLDGSWGVCPVYTTGSSPRIWYGNQALTTAFAFAALQLPEADPMIHTTSFHIMTTLSSLREAPCT